jgi:hypothetical protein
MIHGEKERDEENKEVLKTGISVSLEKEKA